MKSITTEDILSMQSLLLNKIDREKIRNTTIGVAGIGGIGSYTVEFLARNGFENFILADLDKYEKGNARQLFMTTKTIGKEKVIVARERIKAINPRAKIVIFRKGINQNSYDSFAKSSDIICAQTDRISSQILLYMGAYENRKVLLHAGRAKWPHKHLITVSIYDFRKTKGRFNPKILNINPRQWGVENTLPLYQLINSIRNNKSCGKIIETINKNDCEYRKWSFKNSLESKNTTEISDKPKKYLLKVAKENPESFYTMAITPELCSVTASLLVTTIKDIILGRKLKRIAIDLYHGKLYENYRG